MIVAQSKVTAQGQVSVPAEVRRTLGVGPGATLEWHEQGGLVVVKRRGSVTSADIHAALFPERPRSRTLRELKAGLRDSIRKRHARR